MQDGDAFLEDARADTHESDTVMMLRIHICLDLENEAGERRIFRLDGAFQRLSRFRLRRKLEVFLQKWLYAEIRHSRSEEHRCQLPFGDFFRIEGITRFIKKLQIITERIQYFPPDLRNDGFIIDLAGDHFQLLHAMGIVLDEDMAHLRLTVIDARVVTVHTDRPVHRTGTDAKHIFNVRHQIERILTEMVDLIHEGEDRDPTIRADLEELLRLRFDALCHIDDHDRRVDSHQRAVGILRKVRMPRSIQDIDAAALVVELQHRARDRDPALFFDFHPVRHRIARRLPRLDGACEMDRTPVKQ